MSDLQLLLMVIIKILIIIGCVDIADKKNRSTTFWCFMGLLFGLLSLFAICFLPKVEEKHDSNR